MFRHHSYLNQLIHLNYLTNYLREQDKICHWNQFHLVSDAVQYTWAMYYKMWPRFFPRRFLVQTSALRLAFAPPGYPHLPQFPVSLPILQTSMYNSVNTRNCEFLVVLLYFDICFFFYAGSFVTVKLAPWSRFWTVKDHTECYILFFILHQKCSSNNSSGKFLSFNSLKINWFLSTL